MDGEGGGKGDGERGDEGVDDEDEEQFGGISGRGRLGGAMGLGRGFMCGLDG